VNGGTDQANACDGINPLLKYDVENTDGDLIVPEMDSSKLAEGVTDENNFEPVYVYFAPPDKNSFVFTKKGAITIGGK
jgi:hypothetical protein